MQNLFSLQSTSFLIFLEPKIPKPLLNAAKCDKTQLGCGDATCLPNEYFCDGSIDW